MEELLTNYGLFLAKTFTLVGALIIIISFLYSASKKQKKLDTLEVENLNDKWSSFGWETTELNGHNVNEIYDYFKKSNKINKPKAIIANTIKGKGFSFSENNNDWHHSVLTNNFYEKALKELLKK